MTTRHSEARKLTRIIYVILAVVSGLCVYLAALPLPPNVSGPSLTIRLSLVLPAVVVWFMLVISTVRFKQYTLLIKKEADGKSLNYIASGLLLLALYLVLLTTRRFVPKIFINSSHLYAAIAIRNYIAVITLLLATILLFIGSRQLVQMVSGPVWSLRRLVLFALMCGVLFGLFVAIFYRVEPHLSPINGAPRFVSSLNILLITYVLPHLIAWTLGGLACVNIAYYASKVSGKIYKTLFHDLLIGLLIIFATCFAAQFLIISSIAELHVGLSLIIVYGLFPVLAVGALLLYHGAKSLERIERE